MGCLQVTTSGENVASPMETHENAGFDIENVEWRAKSLSYAQRLEIGSYCYVDCETVYGVIIDEIPNEDKFIIIDLFEKRQRFASSHSLCIIDDENIQNEVRVQHDAYLEQHICNDDRSTFDELEMFNVNKNELIPQPGNIAKKQSSLIVTDDSDDDHEHIRKHNRDPTASIIGQLIPTRMEVQRSDNDYGPVTDTLR